MRFGIDALPDQASLVARLAAASARGRLGVLAHAASVDRGFRHLLDVLAALGAPPQLLFGPEHGFGGAAQDMKEVAHGERSAQTDGVRARVVSLYGDALDDLIPRRDDLAELELLLIDLCDVGARYYTYVWTALLAVRAALEVGVSCVLLDRPNPIGRAVEGRHQREGYTSFVGWERVPIRHGLSYAEMVCLHLPEEVLGEQVTVVPSDERIAPEWDRPFVLPSPNMPSYDTALVYPGGCLLEGTNLSEGRGHTRPFEISGAPWIDGPRLARELHATGLEGFVARPVSFIPTFHKHGQSLCHGVQIHPTEPSFRPVATYAAMIAAIHAQDPERFRFRTERYEFVDDIPAFDLLTGSAETRQAIEAGEPPRDIAAALSAVDPDWPEQMQRARARVLRAAPVPEKSDR